MITRKTRRGMIILSVLTIVSFWIGHKQKEEIIEPVAGLDPRLNYVLRDFEMQFFDEAGQPSINMQAPELRNNPVLRLGTIESPVIKLNRAGVVWNLSSNSAIVTADKEHVRLAGEVNVLRHEPSTGGLVELNTRDVHIEVNPQTAATDQAVEISDGHNQLRAIGMDLDMKTDTFRLRQQVNATYAVN